MSTYLLRHDYLSIKGPDGRIEPRGISHHYKLLNIDEAAMISFPFRCFLSVRGSDVTVL